MCTMQNTLLKDYPQWWRILPKKKFVQESLYTVEVDCLSVQTKMLLGMEGEQEGDAVYLLPWLFPSYKNGNFNYSCWESRIVLQLSQTLTFYSNWTVPASLDNVSSLVTFVV